MEKIKGVQIRVHEDIHQALKIEAFRRGKTMRELTDEILGKLLKQHENKKNKQSKKTQKRF